MSLFVAVVAGCSAVPGELATVQAATVEPAIGALTLEPVSSFAVILPPDPRGAISHVETELAQSPVSGALADAEAVSPASGTMGLGDSETLRWLSPETDAPLALTPAAPARPAHPSVGLNPDGFGGATHDWVTGTNVAGAGSANTAGIAFTPDDNLSARVMVADRLIDASVPAEAARVPSFAAPAATSSVPVPAIVAAPTNAAAYAWGLGGYGNLGNGTTEASTTPVPVSNLGNGVAAVAVGSTHSLAIQNGAVYAWGDNAAGELGNGTKTSSSVPVAVSTLASGVTAVAGGMDFSLAVQNGAAYAWGSNGYGDLGNGTGSNSSVPVAVNTLTSGVTAVAAGGYHSIAIQNGAAYAWGLGAEGQLGNGLATDSTTPVAVLNLGTGVTAVAAGNADGLAVKNGALYTWGDNGNGQLGDGTTTQRNSPVAILSLSTGVTAVAAGGYHSLAVMNGNVYAWGQNNVGQLGTGNLTNSLTPVEIDPTDLKNITAVAAGQYSSYALASDGSLWVWGDNSYGQLGLGNTTEYKSPQHLVPPSGEMYIAIDADANGNTVEAILVPEPATWLGGVLLFATAGLGLRRRRAGQAIRSRGAALVNNE